MSHHNFSPAAESIRNVSAHRSTVRVGELLSCPGRATNGCKATCPGVIDPPCSRANRQLRAAVRTAEAVRPPRHTRLGSRTSDKNLSDSSLKWL